MLSRISNYFRVTVGTSVVALLCLFFNNLAHADYWDKEITTNGCIIYEWWDHQSPDFKKEPRTYSWSGQCKRGAPISGRGTLTTKFVDRNMKATGEFKNGVPHGDFVYIFSDEPKEKHRFTFNMGCSIYEGRISSSACVPGSAGVAKLDELSNQQSQSSPSNQQSQSSQSQQTQGGKYGALALIIGRGNLYGWAVDLPTQEAANKRSLDECTRFGTGTCTVMMEFRNACASYAIDSARSSTAYGWAYAADKNSADIEAINECSNRGGAGSQCSVRVWGCTTR